MAVYARDPQSGNTAPDIFIPAPGSTATNSPTGSVNRLTSPGPSNGGNIISDTPIVAQSGSAPITSSPTPSSTSSPTPSAVSSASPSATAAATHHGPKATTIVAIVVPIVVVLCLPLLYLLYRSHKMKTEDEKLATQRNSREAMIEKETRPPQNNGPPPPRPKRSPLATKAASTPRLSLFNFELSPSNLPQDRASQVVGAGAPRHSLARSLQLRRSQASGQQGLRNPLAGNPTSVNRDSSTIVYAEPPPPYQNQNQASNTESNFAPLNLIGTAVGQPPRPKPARNASNGADSTQRSTSHKRPRSSEDRHVGLSFEPPLPALPTEQDVSRPVSPLSSKSIQSARSNSNRRPPNIQISNPPSSATAANVHQPPTLPTFGLGMNGRFTVSEYDNRAISSSPSSVYSPYTSGTPSTVVPIPSSGPISPMPNINTTRNSRNPRHDSRISDVSGLSVDPDWLSNEERERRGQGDRVSTVSGGLVSPIDDESREGSLGFGLGGMRGRDR